MRMNKWYGIFLVLVLLVTALSLQVSATETTPQGYWALEGENWYYYENGAKVTNAWRADSAGKCYLGGDGAMVKNAWALEGDKWRYLNQQGYITLNNWAKDSWGWCFLDENGDWVKDAWRKDSKGWCYIDSYGYWLQKGWAKDGAGWCYMENGYMIYNAWRQDTKGWCYIGDRGYMVVDNWAKDSVGWCYLGKDGYMVYNTWKADSKGWCYINHQGYMATNSWAKDSYGWCYLDSSGYMLADQWVTDTTGEYYIDAAGHMTTRQWARQGDRWCYVNAQGHKTIGWQSSDPNPPTPTADVELVIQYFNEVALDAEFTSGSGNASLVQKWTTPIYFSVNGNCTQQDVQVLSDFAIWLTSLEGFPGVYPAEGQAANLTIHFCDEATLINILGTNLYGCDGGVTFWYDNNEIYNATICYRTDIDQQVRNSVILEEIYNGLGPVQDTWLREDSIIYAGYSAPQALTDTDKLILALLYHPDIQCGMDAQQCAEIIRELYS